MSQAFVCNITHHFCRSEEAHVQLPVLFDSESSGGPQNYKMVPLQRVIGSGRKAEGITEPVSYKLGRGLRHASTHRP